MENWYTENANYKIDKPLSSNFRMEEREKNSCRTWKQGDGRTVNHVKTF